MFVRWSVNFFVSMRNVQLNFPSPHMPTCVSGLDIICSLSCHKEWSVRSPPKSQSLILCPDFVLLTFFRTSLVQLSLSPPWTIGLFAAIVMAYTLVLILPVLKKPSIYFLPPLKGPSLFCSLSQTRSHGIHFHASHFLFHLHLSEFCLQLSTRTSGRGQQKFSFFPNFLFSPNFPYIWCLCLQLLASWEHLRELSLPTLKCLCPVASLTPLSQ